MIDVQGAKKSKHLNKGTAGLIHECACQKVLLIDCNSPCQLVKQSLLTFELSSKCVPALAARAPDRKVGPKLTITLANLRRILINRPINQLKTNKQHDNQPTNPPT